MIKPGRYAAMKRQMEMLNWQEMKELHAVEDGQRTGCQASTEALDAVDVTRETPG